MIKDWKFYRLRLQKWQSFVIYDANYALDTRDGRATLANDETHYPGPRTIHYWNEETNKVERKGDYGPDFLTFPTQMVKADRFEDFLLMSWIPELIDYYTDKELYTGVHMLLLTKDWGEFWEVGGGPRFKLWTDEPDTVAQHCYERILSTWVFR
jgi:hypothetical protein